MCPVYVVKDVTGPYLLPPLPLGEDSGEGALSLIELSLTHSLSQGEGYGYSQRISLAAWLLS